MNELHPVEGEPLLVAEFVSRLAPQSKDGRVSPATFTLSSDDQNGKYQSLSVWAKRFTSCDQAREFMDEKKASYRLCAFLNVSEIRALRPEPDSPDVSSLDVVWEPLADPRPGVRGHAGLIGLLRPSGVGKTYYKSLRAQLAELANENLIALSDLA